MKKFVLLGMAAFVLGACGNSTQEEAKTDDASSTEQTASTESATSEQGKRSNPNTLADTFEMAVQYTDPDSENYETIDGRIKVTFNEVTLGQEAQDFLLSENELNEEAPEGYQWAIFDTSVELLEGSEDVPFSLFLTETVYDGNGASIDNMMANGYSNNQLSDKSIFPGAVAQGNIVLLVPENLDGSLMEMSYLGGGDTVYVDLSK